MRIVYLYVSNGSCDPLDIKEWDPNSRTIDPFSFHFGQEGFCYLFHKLIEQKIIDEVLVVIESSAFPGCIQDYGPNISLISVPHLNELWKYVRDDDIIWARGGWRSWFEFLTKWHDLGRWLLYYRAASNRGAWKFWDIVLNDLQTEYSQDGTGRFYYPINKPVVPDLFYPTGDEQIYDLCVGASHVHSKKGQRKIVPILDEYEKRYKTRLRCVVPGAFHHQLSADIIYGSPHDITIPGMLAKDDLRKVYNQSKLFIHCGAAGQNDRGPLEAMACGTPIMLSNEIYHPRWMNSLATPLSFHVSADEPEIAAQQINLALDMINLEWRTYVQKYYEWNNDVENVIIPQFKQLFSMIAKTPHKKRQDLFNSLLATLE